MNSRSIGPAAVLGVLVPAAFACLIGAHPAAAFSLKAPVQAVENLLTRVRQIAQPAKQPAPTAASPAEAEHRSLSAGSGAAPGKPDGATARAARPDSADNAILEEVLLSPEPYHYQTVGRRDPFVSLISDDAGEAGAADASREKLFVRGILWAENDRFALVENSAGSSYILRQGDRCGRYTVTRIQPDAVVVYSSEYGTGKTEVLPLSDEKGSNHESSAP